MNYLVRMWLTRPPGYVSITQHCVAFRRRGGVGAAYWQTDGMTVRNCCCSPASYGWGSCPDQYDFEWKHFNASTGSEIVLAHDLVIFVSMYHLLIPSILTFVQHSHNQVPGPVYNVFLNVTYQAPRKVGRSFFLPFQTITSAFLVLASFA